MKQPRCIYRWAAAALLLCGAATGHADPGFPTKPVTLIVPFVAGGGTDAAARLLAEKLSVLWGQSVIVDNRGGAGGIIGVEAMVHSRPDGYTLLMGNVGTQAINPSLYPNLPYDPKRDTVPIAMMAELPIVLVASPSFPAQSVKDLVALGQAEPGKHSYASSGVGNSTHLACEIFQSATGTRFLHVPYKGGGQANADVIAGHVEFQFTSVLGNLGVIRSGKMRPLAVASATRSPTLPDVPTMAEAGVSNAEIGSWVGLFAPKGTPEAIVEKIAADLRQVIEKPEVREMLIAQGASPRATTPQEFSRIIDDDTRRFATLIKEKGIQIN